MRTLPACLFMLIASSAAAADQKVEGGTAAPSAPPPAAAAVQGTPADDPNRKICKTIYPTGSRVKGVKDCRTAAQWDR